jgi:hypothetical protein
MSRAAKAVTGCVREEFIIAFMISPTPWAMRKKITIDDFRQYNCHFVIPDFWELV